MTTGPQPSTDLRHDAARRRAVAGHLAEHRREARDRPPARAAGRRRHRGRLPDHLARRLRGRAGDRPPGRGPDHRRPGPRPRRRHRRAWEAVARRRAPAHPHVHLDLGHPHRAPAADHARGRQGPGPRGGRPGPQRCARTSSSRRWTPRAPTWSSPPRWSQIAIDEGATTINIPDTVGYTMPHEYAAYLERLYELGAGPARRRAVGALPRRPRAGGRQLVRRRAGRARGRWSARSTASASAPATRRSRRS